MAKMSIIFNGFDELAEKVDKANGDLKKAVNEALTETQKLVQQNLTSAAAPYAGKGRKGYATGAMFGAILKNARIEWAGSVATVHVGFDLTTKGGYHSIFMMYGTPRIAKDAKLYNAIKGTAIKKAIAEKQKEVMQKYITLDG